MKKTIIFALLSIVCLNTGAQSLPFLLYNADPRALALASVAQESNAAASVLGKEKLDISASYGMWAPESSANNMIGFNGFGIFGKFSAGLSAKYNIGKECELYGPDAWPLGTFKPTGMAIGASFAYRIVDSFSAGLRVNYIASSLAETAKTSAIGADITLAYRKEGFGASLAVRNVGTPVKYGDNSYKLPALASVGAAYSVNAFALQAEAGFVFSGSFMAGVGVQYTLIDIFTFRAGFHYGDEKSVPMFASVGLGINFHGAMLNATYLPSIGGNGSALLFGAGYSF
ncbi:MAG: PorV/PorQ family protein [Bacteroidales bacterium]|nr:PorV/PorQ family protein [Bacteroidales bacterium]